MINVFQESCLKKITYKEVQELNGGYNSASALIGEEFAYQVVLRSDEDAPTYLDYELYSGRERVKLYSVKQVPVPFPHRDDDPYPDYLADEPCILPDCLIPIHNRGTISAGKFPTVLWITVTADTPGDHSIILRFHNEATDFTTDFNLHVVNERIDGSGMSYAGYLFPNGVSEPYNGAPFTDIYWSHIKDYFRVLSENGINELYVPIFPVIQQNAIFSNESQMVAVSVHGTKSKPEYKFNYDIFDCWIYMAEKYKFNRYILPSFYPDLKNKKCLQIHATGLDATKTTLFFGRENDCTSNYYFSFVRKFYRSFKEHLKELGILEKFKFSDPIHPTKNDVEALQKASDGVSDILRLSHRLTVVNDLDLFHQYPVQHPTIPMSQAQFCIENESLHNTGIYIDIGAPQNPINQLIASPSVRLRALSLYCFRYDIYKFFNFGINCINTFEFGKTVHPIFDTDNENCYPSGSLSLIYPAPNCVYESIHLKQLFYAFQDLAALRQYAHYVSTKTIISQIDASSNVNFRRCLIREQSYLNFRERVRNEIEKRIEKTK